MITVHSPKLTFQVLRPHRIKQRGAQVAMSPGETGCLAASETQLDLPGILGRGGGVGIDVQASGH